MKMLNVRESTIARDTLLITVAEYWVKCRVPKLLLEFSLQQFNNELITSADAGGFIGARHADKNYVINIDTMIRSLAPPQLRPMTYHQKLMYVCTICKISKYVQELLNAWWRKQSKTIKYKAYNSSGGGRNE